MKPDDLPAFSAMLTDVLKYYRQPPTDFLLEVWWTGMQRFDLGAVRRALNAHIADPERGMYAPKVADVVRQLAGTSSDRAALAWGKVMDAMRRVGAWQDVLFDDPVIHAVVEDMGGWPKVARTENADLSYAQHRFVETYRSLSERGVEGYPRVLAGARDSDVEYERKGLPVPSPVLVGDPVQCLLVRDRGGEARAQLTFVPAGASLERLPGGFQFKRLPGASEEASNADPR